MPSSIADLAELGKMLEDHRLRLLAMLRRRIDTAPIDPEDILHETFLLARKKWVRFIEQARMRPHIRFFINRQQVFDLARPLQPSDEVFIVQALSGG